MKAGEYTGTNTVISLLGLVLIVVGTLCATILRGGNQSNLIFGIVAGVMGVATIVIYLPLVFRR